VREGDNVADVWAVRAFGAEVVEGDVVRLGPCDEGERSSRPGAAGGRGSGDRATASAAAVAMILLRCAIAILLDRGRGGAIDARRAAMRCRRSGDRIVSISGSTFRVV
jgi:hypothetical protein